MGRKISVAYYSTTRGVTQQETETPITYHGKAFKISKQLFSEEGEVDFETDINQLVQEVQDKGLEPVLDGATVERYETWDVETGDVWVMYRVPCVAKEA